MTTTPSATTGPATGYASGYAAVNGLSLYYEIHGSGEGTPLVLLHGGLGSTGMFGGLLPQLAAGRRAIAVDLQAHGRTADIDRPITYEAMGDDVAALIRRLGLPKADLMGYSLGAGTALQAAIRHPEVVNRLVVVSQPYKRNGWHAESLAGMDQMGPQAAEMMKPSPIYQNYAAIAPRPEDWTRLVTKVGELLRRDYDWSAEVAALEPQVMLVYGDADAVRPAHVADFYALLGGGQRDAGWDGSGMSRNRLAILPGMTHYDIFTSPVLASVVKQFLSG